MKPTASVWADSLGFSDSLPLAWRSLANLTRHRPEEVVTRGPRYELEYADEASERDRIIDRVGTLGIPMIANAVPIGCERSDRNDATEYSDGNSAADARFCSFLRDGRCRGSPKAPDRASTALDTALQGTISSAVRNRFRVVAESSAAAPLGAAATSRLICLTSESYSRRRR